jgi:hypothetical protein
MSFRIESVRRRRSLFFVYYEVIAIDSETGWTVIASFANEGVPNESRIIEGLGYELTAAKTRDAFYKLPGRIIG